MAARNPTGLPPEELDRYEAEGETVQMEITTPRLGLLGQRDPRNRGEAMDVGHPPCDA